MNISEKQARNAISLAPAPLVKVLGKPYYDLDATVELCRRFLDAGVVDGFELQNLAEWDARTPPRDDRQSRLDAWTQSRRYTVDALAERLNRAGIPILSVHANRDVGICLCASQPDEVEHGKQLIDETLTLAEAVRAEVCVIHLWDTWKESFDPTRLKGALDEAAARHPAVTAAVENVPTHLPGRTPFDLARTFEHITLDLRWAALYDELDRFEEICGRIRNVHLSAGLDGTRWAVCDEWFPSGRTTFILSEAMHKICAEWGYTGLLTVEASGILPAASFESLAAAMRALRACANEARRG